MRELILDTETTHLESDGPGRIIEIGLVELEDRYRTGDEFQRYINPEVDVSESSLEVHGLDNAFLERFPVFRDIVQDLLEFMGTARLVIHNASFDMAFLNKELKLAGCESIPPDRVFDTLDFARQTLPGRNRHSLDALCRYYRVDTSGRSQHGALLDALLLSEVYLCLRRDSAGTGGMLQYLEENNLGNTPGEATGERPHPLPSLLTENEDIAHRRYVREQLGRDALWLASQG